MIPVLAPHYHQAQTQNCCRCRGWRAITHLILRNSDTIHNGKTKRKGWMSDLDGEACRSAIWCLCLPPIATMATNGKTKGERLWDIFALDGEFGVFFLPSWGVVSTHTFTDSSICAMYGCTGASSVFIDWAFAHSKQSTFESASVASQSAGSTANWPPQANPLGPIG